MSITVTTATGGSTFLSIVNACRQEAGVASGDLPTLQGALSMESTRFVNWVNREYIRLLATHPDLRCLRQTINFGPLTPGVATYTPTQVGAMSTPKFTAATFANWKKDSFRIYSSANYGDEMLAAWMPWDQFRNVYVYGNMRTNVSRPVAFTIDPQQNLWFGITPDSTGWYVDGEMYLSPQAMSLDADAPIFPARFHDLIAYRALVAYGVFMNAPEIVQRASKEVSTINAQFLADQLPVITSGPPLA